MLAAARPVAFLTTSDADRARAFYETTLGLRFVEDQGFALVFDLGGLPLRIARAASFLAQDGTVLGWQVGDIDAVVHMLAARGVNLERYGLPEQGPDGVWRSPSGALVAWFRDPDGNVLSVTQDQPRSSRS